MVDEINRAVGEAAREFRPDLIWADKQEFLRAETIINLQRFGAKAVHFTPDPYFYLKWKRTRLMDEAMNEFDALLYCKSYERDDYLALKKPLIYMPLGYCDEVHRPIPSQGLRWQCSIGFVGGWEPRREKCLHAIAAMSKDVKIWGSYWDFLKDGKWSIRRQIILAQLAGAQSFNIHRDDMLAKAYQGVEVYGDDYARALTGARIGLGFLRRVCPDQHTTRTFEIPACGSMLLADRTNEQREFFEEGKEAEFFDSAEELLDKVRFYSTNETARASIAANGLRRCAVSGYSYIHRLKNALDTLTKLNLVNEPQGRFRIGHT